MRDALEGRAVLKAFAKRSLAADRVTVTLDVRTMWTWGKVRSLIMHRPFLPACLYGLLRASRTPRHLRKEGRNLRETWRVSPQEVSRTRPVATSPPRPKAEQIPSLTRAPTCQSWNFLPSMLVWQYPALAYRSRAGLLSPTVHRSDSKGSVNWTIHP